MQPTTSVKSLTSTLPKAIASCSTQALAYGQCIGARYNDIEKNVCKIPFDAFKACVSKSLKK